MYKITATVIRAGGLPTDWVRFSKVRLTQAQCERMLFKPKEAGKSFGCEVELKNFRCESFKRVKASSSLNEME